MLVSVIIPYFNDEININKSVFSALNQTYKKIEIIIVDDENSFKSFEILKKFKNKKKIKIIRTNANLGVARARNLGIRKSKGKLIAFLDSDDFWKKNKLSEQVLAFKNKDIDVCYSNYYGIVDDNRVIYSVEPPREMNFKKLLKSCPISCSTVLIKKNILKKNCFRNLKTKEDYLLWLELSKKNYKFFGINKYLSFYRIRNKSLSSLHLNKLFSAFKIYYYYLKFNFFISLLLISRLYINAFIKKYL